MSKVKVNATKVTKVTTTGKSVALKQAVQAVRSDNGFPKPGTPEFQMLTPGKKAWATRAQLGWVPKPKSSDDPRYAGLVAFSKEWYSAVAHKAVESRLANTAILQSAALKAGKKFTPMPVKVTAKG